MKNLYAFTETKFKNYPAYISINKKEDGKYIIFLRSTDAAIASDITLSLDEMLHMVSTLNQKVSMM